MIDSLVVTGLPVERVLRPRLTLVLLVDEPEHKTDCRHDEEDDHEPDSNWIAVIELRRELLHDHVESDV